ncbi:MAG: DUF3822 family protein [Dysgonamonadaceae bacterium]|jgi:hypothetical protein|nr:DUF3822 family protein [Dysgonamonadaceae bacterium]
MKIQIPEYINFNDAEQCILTIRIHKNGYSFSVYNPLVNASYFYHIVEFGKQTSAFSSFQDAFFDNDFFTLTYRQVYVINYTHTFTYVPSLIFEDSDKETYINFLFMEKAGKTLYHKIKNQEIIVIHKMEEEVYDFFMRSFPDVRIIHHTAPLIAYFRSKQQIVNRNRLIINLQQTEMDVLCFSQETFLLGNHYVCNNLMDIVYHILFIWKQMKFNQLNDFLYIAGGFESKKPLIDNLKIYIQNIIPANIIPEAHFERIDVRAIPFEITCLSLCEL